MEERIDGRLVAMAPAASNHNLIAGNIFGLFWQYLRGKRCTPFGDGTALYLSGTDYYIPDMMVVCDPEKVKWDGVHGAPDLVVEVISPRTVKYDRGRKKDVYESSGVREYWIVSPREKSIEQYLLTDGKFVLSETYTLYPDYELEAMTEKERAQAVTEFQCSLFADLNIRLEDVFARVP